MPYKDLIEREAYQRDYRIRAREQFLARSNRFYTYMFLRENGMPYYVGKGCGDRAFVKPTRRKGPWAPKDRSRILVQHWTSEAEALEMEKVFIDMYGRKDNGTGCLRNLTDGGENPPRAKKGHGL